MDVRSSLSYLYWLFCQFELITCSYLMEPWEKLLFYSFNLALLGLLLYTTYVCVALQASSAFQLLCSLLANPQDSALAVVK
ncbi:serine palmitoyltransferase small subunit B-like [Catharus ustulatus]|nr:serine palmitoyltransferase small subunit B-like [Catharus ustulatus]NXQ41791.1 SPTSB palmitoyltransferase [Catharus fuscescens]